MWTIHSTENEKHENSTKSVLNTGDPEGLAVPAPLVAHDVLLLSKIQRYVSYE